MKDCMQIFPAVLLTCALASGAGAAEPIISMDNVRIWQTVFKPDEPLQWRWEDGATEARVTVSNALTDAVTGPLEIPREGTGLYGQYRLPSVTEETVFDVTLEQVGESGVIGETCTARLACLPGADGGGIAVDPMNRRFFRMEGPRVAAFDSDWVGGPLGAGTVYSFDPAEDGDPVRRELPWSSGYFVQSLFPGTLQISFPGCAEVLEATLLARQGLSIIVR